MHVSRNKKKLTVGYNLTDASCSVYIERSCDSATPQWPHLADEILLSPDLEARGRLRAASSSSLISGGSRYFEQGEDSVSAPLSFANAHNGIPPALCTVKFPALSETNYSTTPRHFCTALASFLQSSEDSSFRPFFSLSFFSACEPSAYQTIASLSGHFPHFCYLLTYLLTSVLCSPKSWWLMRRKVDLCRASREKKSSAAAATVGSCMLGEETPGREGEKEERAGEIERATCIRTYGPWDERANVIAATVSCYNRVLSAAAPGRRVDRSPARLRLFSLRFVCSFERFVPRWFSANLHAHLKL